MGRRARAVAVVLGLGGLLLTSAVLSAAPAAAQDGGGGQPRVTICHREGNGSFHEITVAAPSLPAHAAHGDIIPAPAEGCPSGTPGGGANRVSICHREGNGSFHEITIDDNALDAHLAHGDIYPVPADGCPGTPPTVPPVVGGGGGTGGVVVNNPVPRPNPPAAAPAPVVSPAASAPVPVELPRTGARDVGIELAIAAALLLLGGLLLKGSAWAAASAEPALAIWLPAPLDPPDASTPARAARRTLSFRRPTDAPWSVAHRAGTAWQPASAKPRAGPRRRRSRAP